MASPGKKSYLLRIDPALWAEIERLAAQELRSANAQVEFLLREGLAKRGACRRRLRPPRTRTRPSPRASSNPEFPEGRLTASAPTMARHDLQETHAVTAFAFPVPP